MVDWVSKLIDEMDAKYIKGMINNPNMHPNAAVNCWITAILIFNFELVHVPVKNFKGPDGMLRRRKTEDEGDIEEDLKDWVEEILMCGLWVAAALEDGVVGGILREEATEGGTVLVLAVKKGGNDEVEEIPRTANGMESDEELREIKAYLETLKKPAGIEERKLVEFLRKASRFFVKGGRLWKDTEGKHKLVVFRGEEAKILKAVHDNLRHRGFYPT